MKALLYFSDRIASKKEIRDIILNSGIKIVNARQDIILVFGGDGTLLESERKHPQIPKILISGFFGSLGYLAGGSVENLEEILNRIKKGKYRKMERMKLDVIYDGNKGTCLNEVLLTSRLRGRSVKIELLRNGNPLLTLNCDGIILFTPTGSTAYSMSCGGPILKTGAIGVTLINPHLSPTNYLILDERDKLTVRVLAGEAVMVLDGGPSIKVKGSIKIQKSRNTAHLISIRSKGIPEVCPPRVMIR